MRTEFEKIAIIGVSCYPERDICTTKATEQTFRRTAMWAKLSSKLFSNALHSQSLLFNAHRPSQHTHLR